MKTISNPTYVLRTCNKNLQGYGGFQWPKKGFVEAPDWNPEPVCGGGLHGLLMGKGAANLLNWGREAIWQVIEVQEDTVVWVDNEKVKFPFGNVIYSGNRKDATDLLISLGADPKDVPGSFQIGGDGSTLTGGNRSILQGGERSTLTGGDGSTLQGGDYSTLQSGPRSTLTGGDYSNVQGGFDSTLRGGYMSNLTGGDFSNVQGGKGSTVQGGEGSTLTGDYWSKFKAGEESCFIGSYWKEERKRFVTVYVGEDGIKADTWYRFENRVFTEVVDN